MSCGCSALVVGRLATGGGAGVAVAGGVVESCGAGVVDGGVELDGVAVGGTGTAVRGAVAGGEPARPCRDTASSLPFTSSSWFDRVVSEAVSASTRCVSAATRCSVSL